METYDVVVVGGGAAGLSGALTLARARRRVLVVDDGAPRNAPAGQMHNYLGREGTPPAQLLAIGRAEVAGYGAEFADGPAADARAVPGGFELVAGGRPVRARRLLVATGLVDELPELPGLREHWGSAVLHCPYCHGWEVRDKRIGVLATGPLAMHGVLLWRQWSEHVSLLSHTAPDPDADDREKLAARGITVVPGPVAAVATTADGAFAGVRLENGNLIELDALVVQTRMTARTALLEQLGLKTTEMEMNGHVIASYVAADATGRTDVPGVWVAGNVTDPRAQVLVAAAQGLTAGAQLNMDLIEEDTRDAVHARHTELRDLLEQESWEERYRSKPAIWSGNPNAQLVAEVTDLTPGTALDVGSGEGADAIWLAQRGWQVTGVDISTVALERAATHAGPDTHITWVHADVREWEPPAGAYDLVSAHFMQLPRADRLAVFARLAAAVAPGGTLLIVGHHPTMVHTPQRGAKLPDMMYPAEEVAELLDPTQWELQAVETRPRSITDPDGQPTTIHDAVLRARRLSR